MTEQEFLTKYTDHLNDKQREAVKAVDGPTLLLAVPGSGKTTVLVTRLGYMLFCKGIAPEHILTLTYTVAATRDMAGRFSKLFGEQSGAQLEFRTINGICAKIIQRYGELIGKEPFELLTNEGTILKIITDALAKQMQEYPTESDVKAARTMITYCKNMMLSGEEIKELGEQEGINLLDIYNEFNDYLKSNSLMDYDDQMVYAHIMLKTKPELLAFFQDKYRYICVDEAQDTSKVQHAIIKLLAGTNGNLFMVGDEDQSIYGFRAAYPQALLDFEKDHPKAKVLVMNKNYRSNARIVSVADRFIQRNKERFEKHMEATRDAATEINIVELGNRANQYSYLKKVATDCVQQTAVLYRDNECMLPLVDRLDREQIPYYIKSNDLSFFTHRIVVDVTSILRLALNPKDTDLFMRIYFKCKTYLKKQQAEQMCRISKEKDIPVLDAAKSIPGLNARVKANCKSLATHLSSMIHESPSKALFRIDVPLGYGEYLEKNGIDDNKLYILKQLAYAETSVVGYLKRLDYLREMLRDGRPDRDCPFILSTIHSSKGLEYDRVYLMDICDGVFPAKVLTAGSGASMQEMSQFEEERRLFYVGMTRAKDELHIFKIKDETSVFLQEMMSPVKKLRPVEEKMQSVNKPQLAGKLPQLAVGAEVEHNKFGCGTIIKVERGTTSKYGNFDVMFDGTGVKTFSYPFPFEKRLMRMAGDEIPLAKTIKKANGSKKKTEEPKKKSKTTEDKKKYVYWVEHYPGYVVVKKEGYFWTCRGEGAIVLHDLLGYKIANDEKPATGSTNLEKIRDGLRKNEVNYIVVEDGEVVEKWG